MRFFVIVVIPLAIGVAIMILVRYLLVRMVTKSNEERGKEPVSNSKIKTQNEK
ncbi:MAG: hypothetical protein QMD66_04590 [Actinomycetota bacterium]|nr:hypothetical protein [Actinomycetota bacterium]